jgi:hypothetical protein
MLRKRKRLADKQQKRAALFKKEFVPPEIKESKSLMELTVGFCCVFLL